MKQRQTAFFSLLPRIDTSHVTKDSQGPWKELEFSLFSVDFVSLFCPCLLAWVFVAGRVLRIDNYLELKVSKC